MEKAGKNRSDYKKVNRGLVMKMIATGQCSTRADLTRSTGLSKMAISNIVTELIRQHLLVETEAARVEELGRTPVRLGLSPEAPKVVGLLIDRDRCEAVLCSLDLKVLRRETVTMENMTGPQLTDLIYQLLDTILFGRVDVVAIGAASIGPISARAGKILRPFYFYGIHDVEVVRIIQERYHLPVYFDHDNQSAILAESLFGSGRGYNDVLYVGVSQGVGCGILSDGQLYCNRRGLPPELGHVSVDLKGRSCGCGNRGCVETYLRTPELLKKLRYHTGKYYTYEGFCALAEGDERVDSILTDAVMRLSNAVISIVNILNSELILLGSDSTFWPDRYLTMLEDEVNRRRFVDWDERILVKRSYFMRDASLMGAACNAISPIFLGELLFEP
ncbi:MAG: ROK family protein [Lawsonibacter sp.]|jgi:predicted NBD/HSP70 family sugar kinase|nr:ROK family protein [Lawsonibacter sp.]MCI9567850.1 ROK family protein [Lawsonibacter sp.]